MANDNIQETALKVFKKHMPEQFAQIKTIKDIHNGYTNYSFMVELNDGTKYQIRIPHSGELINRKIELAVLSLSNYNLFVYFDDKTGIAIKKWVEGSHPGILKIKNKVFVDNLFTKIKNLHAIDVDQKKIPIKKIAIDEYNKYLYDLDFNYQNKYLALIDKRKKDQLVLSHSDINPLNVIVDDQDNITLIDFEWCCLASDYWDYANWTRETNFNFWNVEWSKFIKDFSMATFIEYLFISSVFAYVWTYAMPESKDILAYRKKVVKQVDRYYKVLIENEQKTNQ